MTAPKSDDAPLVTVIIPTFNHAQHLRKALDSVVAQTFQDWEAVVVNNHSTDDTVEVVAATNDPRISLVNFRNHGVIGASRNQGLKVARGKFVAFLDSDDVWYPQKLQRCVEQISGGGEFICHGELWINSDKTSRKVFYGPVENSSYEKLLFRGNCISTSTTFIKTELLRSIDGFDESPEIVTAEDYDLWLRLAATGAKTVFIKEILGEFHRLQNSASSAVLRNLSSELMVLQKHFQSQPNNILNALKRRHRLAIANYGAARQLHGQPAQSLRLFLKAFVLSPMLIKIYPGVVLLLVGALKGSK